MQSTQERQAIETVMQTSARVLNKGGTCLLEAEQIPIPIKLQIAGLGESSQFGEALQKIEP